MRVQAATICVQVPRFTRLRELRDALRRWLVDGERGAATSRPSANGRRPGAQRRGGAREGAREGPRREGPRPCGGCRR